MPRRRQSFATKDRSRSGRLLSLNSPAICPRCRQVKLSSSRAIRREFAPLSSLGASAPLLHAPSCSLAQRWLPESRSLSNTSRRPEAHNKLDSLSRNRVANLAFTVCSAGEIVVLAVLVGVLHALHSDDSTENNTKALSVVCAYAGGVWLVCAIPWFIFEKHRPGRKLPEGSSYLTIGFKVLWQALVKVRQCSIAAVSLANLPCHRRAQIRKLTDALLYLAFYFLMSDVLNTTVSAGGLSFCEGRRSFPNYRSPSSRRSRTRQSPSRRRNPPTSSSSVLPRKWSESTASGWCRSASGSPPRLCSVLYASRSFS